MKIKLFFFLILISFLFAQSNSFYDFKANTIDGKKVSMDQYKGKLVLVVNTASKCGLTPQYEGLEKLNKKYKDKGLVILGFPCNQFAGQEPGSEKDILKFCNSEYGVSFQLFSKVDVRGENPHPIFSYLVNNTKYDGFDLNTEMGKKFQGFLSAKFPEIMKGNGIKWNFTKFLVGKDGKPIKRFEPTITPEEIEKELSNLL